MCGEPDPRSDLAVEIRRRRNRWHHLDQRSEAAFPVADGLVERRLFVAARRNRDTLIALECAEHVLAGQCINVVEFGDFSRHPLCCARLRCSHVLIVPSGLLNRLAIASRLSPCK